MRVEILNIFLIFMLGLLISAEGYNLGLEDMPHISDPSPTLRWAGMIFSLEDAIYIDE